MLLGWGVMLLIVCWKPVWDHLQSWGCSPAVSGGMHVGMYGAAFMDAAGGRAEGRQGL